MNIFKAYDVRGRYPSELNEPLAERIAAATALWMSGAPQGKTFAVGHDVRLSAPSIAEAVAQGITRVGGNIVELGLVTTPMLYFAVGHGDASHGYDGGIMVTASHNPPEYIGLKICRENAIPVGENSGLKEIEQSVKNADRPKSALPIGKRTKQNILDDYRKHILQFAPPSCKLRVVVDTANGCVGHVFDAIFRDTGLSYTPLCFKPDGTFPNHEPDPLKDKNIQDLCRKVREVSADFGVAFDGDGDRALFVDEQGKRIPADWVTALFAREILAREKGATILYDVRSSRVVREEIEKAGGKPVRERVGHAFMKKALRQHQAPLGGELSGHYYFRDHFYCDSGLLAFAKFLSLAARQTQKASQWLALFKRYANTGELNFRVEDKAGKQKELARVFADGKQDFLDGITVDYPDWWFNVRPSNTEPLLRLNAEARTPQLLEEAQIRLFQILGKPL